MRIQLAIIGLMLLGGCAFENDLVMGDDPSPGNTKSVTWIDRKNGVPKENDELLALKVVRSAGKTQTEYGVTARLVDEDPPFSIIAVEGKSPDDPDKNIRILYRFNEETIVASSYPEYIEPEVSGADKEKRRRYAREIAMEARDHRTPLMPLMYEGKYAYSPRYDGGCTVVVTEKNTSMKVIGTYTIDVCTGEK